eukprot:scaffold2671_cov167-Amphora_coffeaeformis.AAC.5
MDRRTRSIVYGVPVGMETSMGECPNQSWDPNLTSMLCPISQQDTMNTDIEEHGYICRCRTLFEVQMRGHFTVKTSSSGSSTVRQFSLSPIVQADISLGGDGLVGVATFEPHCDY